MIADPFMSGFRDQVVVMAPSGDAISASLEA